MATDSGLQFKIMKLRKETSKKNFTYGKKIFGRSQEKH